MSVNFPDGGVTNRSAQGYRLICVSGAVEVAGLGTHPSIESAREEGDGWYGDVEAMQVDGEDGEEFYYVVEDAGTREEVYRYPEPEAA